MNTFFFPFFPRPNYVKESHYSVQQTARDEKFFFFSANITVVIVIKIRQLLEGDFFFFSYFLVVAGKTTGRTVIPVLNM